MPSTYIWSATPQRYVGKCEPCFRPVSLTIKPEGGNALFDEQKAFPNEKLIPCPDCGGMCPAKLLYGTINKMDCDTRCMGAYGPICVCACGGENHSNRWEQKIDNVPFEVIEAYRADITRRREQAEARREATKAADRTRFEKWAEEHIEQTAPILAYDGDIYFILSIREQFGDCKILSPRQLEVANRVILEEKQKKAAKEEMAKLNAPSKHVGTIGEKITVKVQIEKIKWLSGYAYNSPMAPMYAMRDESGNLIVWYASKDAGMEEGGKYTLTGTVKKHNDYEGANQTILTRCKKEG